MNQVATQNANVLEQVIVKGDLALLSEADRVLYYKRVCESAGLNPLTKPFEYIRLNDKLVLYALKGATDQLRQIHGISIQIVSREKMDGVYVVTARATNTEGRQDESIGAVALEKENGQWKQASSGRRFLEKDGTVSPLKGEELSNAIMKGETKAKRRVTLSICGLGMLDETEIESIPEAAKGMAATGGEMTAKQVFGSAKAMKERWSKIRDELLNCTTHEGLEKVFADSKIDFAAFKSVDEQLYDSLVQVGVQRRNAINEASLEEEGDYHEEEQQREEDRLAAVSDDAPAFLRNAKGLNW